MIINGKDRQFMLTVGASADISDVCPDGDIGKINEALTGRFSSVSKKAARIIVALNKGYEENRNPFSDELDVLSVREVLSLDFDTFKALLDEALASFNNDRKPTIETEEPKGKKKDADVNAEATA